MTSRRAAVVTLFLLLGGCDRGEPPPSRPASAPSEVQVLTGGAECPEAASVVLDDATRIGGTLEGDVNGDGVPDAVALHRDDDATRGCKTFVSVESEGTLYATSADDPERDYSLLSPQLTSLVDIDGDGAAEVIVDLEAGASTQFVGIFQLTDEGLARADHRSPRDPEATLFPYGGSVGHIEASNCVPAASGRGEADLVISVATPARAGLRYRVERVFYDLNAGSLFPTGREVMMVSARAVTELPEYETSPFGACRTPS